VGARNARDFSGRGVETLDSSEAPPKIN
jgi:hypothetical protein